VNFRQLFHKMKGSGPFIQFLLIALFIYLSWSIANAFIIQPDGRADKWLKYSQAALSSKWIGLVGYDAHVVEKKKQCLLYLGEQKLIGISDSCDGLALMVLYAGFLLAYPGRAIPKLFFIPAGAILIYCINILRIGGLAIINLHYPDALDFNHHYTFTFLVYGCVFMLWVWYVNRFSKTSDSTAAADHG
jgi:exosortase family protein XrtF